jgi:hypothetical protein
MVLEGRFEHNHSAFWLFEKWSKLFI